MNNETAHFASEENVHVADDLVIEDEEQAKREERRVLQDDIDQDRPDVDGAAHFFGGVTAVVVFLGALDPHLALFRFARAGRQHQSELQQAPRPD